MKPYADTSFLVPLYTLEIGSAAANAVMAGVHGPVFITSFGEIEVCNAIQLMVFRKTLAPGDAQIIQRAFDQDILLGTFHVQPFLTTAFEFAKRLSLKHTSTLGIRSLDLVHVASAIALEATDFLSFDKNQRKLAQAAGLNLHPPTV